MTIFGFNDESLRRRGISHADCMDVIGNPLIIDPQVDSDAGNSCVMFVGYSEDGRLLEVGIEYLEDQDWIYHADTAGRRYRRQLTGERL